MNKIYVFYVIELFGKKIKIIFINTKGSKDVERSSFIG